MPPAISTIQVKGLPKRKMAELAQRANRLGMTPDRYLKHLIEEDLAISQEARTKTFAELITPSSDVDEREIDELVEAAKTKYRRRASRKG
jgi:ABC-type uncharacterized transport system ATPase subunit